MKRFLAALAATALAVSVVPAAQAAEGNELTSIKTERLAGFDRVTFQLSGARPSVTDGRTGQLVGCGSGKEIDAKGRDFVEIHMWGANAHEYTGARRFDTPGLGNVQSVTNTCDFEADLAFGLGTAKVGSPYRISFQDNPTRVVVEINH